MNIYSCCTDQCNGDQIRTECNERIVKPLLISHKCLIEMNKNLLGNSSSNITNCTMIEDYKTHLLLHISHKHLVIKLNKLAQCSPPLSLQNLQWLRIVRLIPRPTFHLLLSALCLVRTIVSAGHCEHIRIVRVVLCQPQWAPVSAF